MSKEEIAFKETPTIKTNGDHKIKEEEDEEIAKASIKIWDYIFGFTDMALIKCVIDLGIPDLLERNGGSISLHELCSSLSCHDDTTYMFRVMRYLVQRKIFNLKKTSQKNTLFYSQTPLSKLLMSHNMAPFIMLESSPTMLAPWLALSERVLQKTDSAFDDVHGKDVWSVAFENESHSKLINEAMASDARVLVPQVIKECPRLFDDVCHVVDVGGGNGTTLSLLFKGYPWIKGINFDLPHVIHANLPCEGVEHVSGSMFEFVPKADVAIIKWVLHDWGDEECIKVLKNCREAIAKDKGKVIIFEGVLAEETSDKYEDARLMLDMVMMAHTTTGKERTLSEWNSLLLEAGFSRVDVTPIQAVQSVIEAYP